MNFRVVVTGMAVISPVGTGLDKFWNNILQGVSGIGSITHFDAEEFPVRFAGEVKDFDPGDFFHRKDARRMDRFAQLAVAAAMMSLKDSGIEINEENCEQIGTLVGSGVGGMSTFEKQNKRLLERGPGRVSPFFIPMMISNMASGQIAIQLGAKGPSNNTVTACASGTHALGEAHHIIKRGDARVMICGGTEAAVTPLSMGGFSSMKALSQRNDEPEKASRPFDLNRDGFVLGEGTGILILEEMEHAIKRGARIYGEVLGYGMSTDAHHITDPAPEGEGAARAMKMAIKNSKLKPEDIDYINAHGTSTPKNDKFETMAIKEIFGAWAYELAVSSTKSMTGHLLGAAGGIEAIASLLTIKNGVIPPTINYETPDPECDLDYVPNQSRRARVEHALSNSLGFGGHNASIVFASFKEQRKSNE